MTRAVIVTMTGGLTFHSLPTQYVGQPSSLGRKKTLLIAQVQLSSATGQETQREGISMNFAAYCTSVTSYLCRLPVAGPRNRTLVRSMHPSTGVSIPRGWPRGWLYCMYHTPLDSHGHTQRSARSYNKRHARGPWVTLGVALGGHPGGSPGGLHSRWTSPSRVTRRDGGPDRSRLARQVRKGRARGADTRRGHTARTHGARVAAALGRLSVRGEASREHSPAARPTAAPRPPRPECTLETKPVNNKPKWSSIQTIFG